MSSCITLIVSLACLTQATPNVDVFRDGKIFVFRSAEADVKLGPTTTRHVLMINDTYFGNSILTEAEGDPLRRKPTTYYHRNGPVGFLFRTADSFPDRPFLSDVVPPASLIAMGATSSLCALAVPWAEPAIGVVGMHSGTIASFAKPLEAMHFFERNPVITKLSLPDGQEKPIFHNINDAQKRGAQIKVISGDLRASIEKAPKGYYKFLFVEMCQRIYLEDIEVELITKEGIKACVDTLTPDGIACFHTSNRYVDVAPLVFGAAKYWKFAAREINDPGESRPRQVKGPFDKDHFSSAWIFVARDVARLNDLGESPLRGPLSWVSRPEFAFYWTDMGPNPLKGILREDPGPGRVTVGLSNWVRKNSPSSWSLQAQEWVRGFSSAWSRMSVARLEQDGATAVWLRKTP